MLSSMLSEAFKKEVGERFKHLVNLIIQRGYAKTPTEVARLMGVQGQAVSMMMSGERVMTLEQMTTLADITHFNPNWLLTNREPVFFETTESEKDIIDLVTEGITTGKIPADKGQLIIKEVNRLRSELAKKDENIHELNSQVIGLLQIIKKS